MAFDYKLPDVGEGLVEAEIVSWKVKPGDTVKVNDIIVEIETAKSLVELPCPYGGTIGELLVPEGQVVEVGTPIVSIATADSPQAQARQAKGATPEKSVGSGEEPIKTLVGYGPRATSTRRRARKRAEPVGHGRPETHTRPETRTRPEARPTREAPTKPEAPTAHEPATWPEAPTPDETATTKPGSAVLAKPPVRKLAKDLGVDLTEVRPTGPNGTITRDDVESFRTGAAVAPGAAVPRARAAEGERETRVPVRGVRRSTAEAVSRSAFTAPHVTEWVTVDVTATMDLLERLRARREFAEVKISPLLVVAKAAILALKRTPELNARWDDEAGEIVLKHYVNLGIAAATPRGLLVPHVKDADRLGLPELAQALGELTRTARDGKTPPEDMIGTTFTITNVGVFGVDAGTPILNPGETGILAVGAIDKRPWVVVDNGTEQIQPRWVSTLALSFDHRVVDGEQGSRFLADLAAMLRDPALAMAFG